MLIRDHSGKNLTAWFPSGRKTLATATADVLPIMIL
jgi:hypothetical protein